jgi:hypothetical protein
VGLAVEVSGRPIAVHVACLGGGTLVVTYGFEAITGPMPQPPQDAVVFPCSAGATTMRHEIVGDVKAGELTVSGGLVPGAGEAGPSVFMISVEEALS